MPETIIIRLHPEKPCTAEEFTDYLTGLIITAYDLSFEHPEGFEIGQASFLPEDPTNNRIFQHLSIPPPPPPERI